MSMSTSSAIKPPTSQTIDAYRAAVLAYRISSPSSTYRDGQSGPLAAMNAATAAVRKLRPGFTGREAKVLAQDAIAWAEQKHNECFWDL
jgi:hypothetical protein